MVSIATAHADDAKPTAPMPTAPAAPASPASPAPTPTAPTPTAPTPTTPTPTTPTAPASPTQTAPPAPTSPASPTQTAPAPTAPAPPAASGADDDGEPRLSLPTQADRTAWRTSGFRLGLGLVYGRLIGLRGAPSGRLIGPTIRAGVRLDDSWSILASFQYASASKSGGLSGLRFAGTVDPTWHVTPSLSLAVGFGFGGIVEGRTGRMDAEPLPSTIDTSYTFPDARTPIASCSGVGAAGLVRVEWSYVLGPRAATGVALELVGQWTGCVDDTNRVEPDTGTAIVRRQWWPHTGATLGWGITWR
ncbi:MAG TPA: hypothetical protein VFT22_35685 [Kofleriaceae bacterium]|nr:hypothetical protein [Kofleriaceae bacterium]